MLKSAWMNLRSALRAHASVLAVLGLVIAAGSMWQGCSEDAPPSASGLSSQLETPLVVVDGDDALPPEVQAKIDLVLGTLADLTSGNQARVDAGFARLDRIEPGLHDQVMGAFERAITGDSDTFTLDIPLELSGRAAQDPKYCVTIKIEGKVTIKKGSKFCYKRVCEGGIGVEHCTELNADTTFDINKTLEYCIDGIEGCSVTHSSTSTTTVTIPLKHSDTKTEGGCTVTRSLDATIVVDLKVTVEVKTCN